MTTFLNLPFLLENDKVIPLDKGHTTAKKWIVERSGKKYFLKATTKAVKKEIYDEVYRQTKSLPKLVEQVEWDGKSFCLYEFKESKDFDALSKNEVLLFAERTANKLKEFSQVKANLPMQNFEDVVKNCKEEIEFFFANRQDSLMISKSEFLLLVDKFSTSFAGQKTVLLHGDLKPENIIFNDEVCFVDTDEMRHGYFAFNFEYSLQMFFDKREQYKQFFHLLVSTFYDGVLPKEFESNLKFICIKKFFNRAKMFLCASDKDGERKFIEEFKPIFEFIKK